MNKERVTFDVFATEFEQTMAESFEMYLRGLHYCGTPEELFGQQLDFMLFNIKVFKELIEVADSAEPATDYH